MVNVGRPSSGCHLCRKRRVKCDESKPGCLKCLKFGQRCPGYRDSSELWFRNTLVGQTISSDISSAPVSPQKRVRVSTGEVAYLNEPDGHRVKLPVSSLSSSTAPTRSRDASLGSLSTSDSGQRKDTEMLITSPLSSDGSSKATGIVRRAQSPQALGYDTTELAVCVFHRCFVETTHVKYQLDTFEVVPIMFKEAGPSSCLRKAINAAAYANLANRVGFSVLDTVIQRAYGDALSSTNNALRDPIRCVSDDTILSIWMLGIFEHIMNMSEGNHKHYGPAFQSWQAHIDGTLAILHLRTTSQLSTPRGRQIFRIIYLGAQMKSLMYGQKEPLAVTKLVEQMYDISGETASLSRKVSSHVREVCIFRSKMKHIASAGMAEKAELLQTAERLDDNTIDWSEATVPVTPAVKSALATSYDAKFATRYYKGFDIYLSCMGYSTAQLLLYDMVVALLQSQLHEHSHNPSTKRLNTAKTAIEARIAQYLVSFRLTARDVIGSVAYALGDINEEGKLRFSRNKPNIPSEDSGYNLTGTFDVYWPLTALKHSRITSDHHMQAVWEALNKITDAFRRV